jgi:hypothetical protein
MHAGGTGPDGPSGGFVPLIIFHGDRDSIVDPINADCVVRYGVRAAAAMSRPAGSPPVETTTTAKAPAGGHGHTRTVHRDHHGRTLVEHWTVRQAGNAWSGDSPARGDRVPGNHRAGYWARRYGRGLRDSSGATAPPKDAHLC